MHTRDVNGGRVAEARGYVAMGERVGATVAGKTQIATATTQTMRADLPGKMFPAGWYTGKSLTSGRSMPPDSWNLNVAKFKAHTMWPHADLQELAGLQCIPFQGYCGRWPAIDQMGKVEKGNQ